MSCESNATVQMNHHPTKMGITYSDQRYTQQHILYIVSCTSTIQSVLILRYSWCCIVEWKNPEK